MADFVLRPSKQKSIMRGLMLASPIFIFHPLLYSIQGILVPGLPAPLYAFQLWMVGAPYLYCMYLLSTYYERIRVRNGVLEYGLLGLNKVPLSRIVEVAGDDGDIGNDFQESIILKFDSEESDKGLVLPIKNYDEHELRAFLSSLREENPACKYSYSDVIPFESRGLIRFLKSVSESESLTVKLSKTPTEDAIIHLVKSHEKIFWAVYLFVWLLVLFALSYYCFLFNAEWSQHPGVTPKWDTSAGTQHAAALLDAAQKNPNTQWYELLLLQVGMFGNIGLDYLSTVGLAAMTTVWMLGGFFLMMFLPMVKLYSPTYLFIDGKSIGMGLEFLEWQGIISVTLEKPGEMGDPLEGRLLVVHQSGARLNIDLTKVPDVQKRQRVLRLIDRYAIHAKFNGEFMRTTNTLMDIQFTDLWLEDQGSTQKEIGGPELRTLSGGAYIIDSLLGYGGQGVTYLASTDGRTTDGGNKVPAGSVVIKELVLPNYADVRIMQDATSRFERGAKLLKELDHPQVVKLLDYFLENGKAYLVMEYVQGETLRDHIEKTGAMPLEKTKELGSQLCDILSFLHDRETPVIHCDFAPDNLIVTTDGGIKLIDFDVARVVDSKAHTFIAGRPSYTPPEQFRGQPKVQSDLFALGALLHFLMEGKDPPPLCAGTNEEEGRASTPIEELIQQCCQFEAADRPASAQEIKMQLVNDGHKIKVTEKEVQEIG